LCALHRKWSSAGTWSRTWYGTAVSAIGCVISLVLTVPVGRSWHIQSVVCMHRSSCIWRPIHRISPVHIQRTPQVIRHYHGHLSGVYSLALHPELDILLTGGRDSVCRVWDMRTRVQVTDWTLVCWWWAASRYTTACIRMCLAQWSVALCAHPCKEQDCHALEYAELLLVFCIATCLPASERRAWAMRGSDLSGARHVRRGCTPII
jgi:hypothetical protein